MSTRTGSSVATEPRRFSRDRTTLALLLILAVAAVLRLANLTDSPPGLNQDEAANAWNAYCLLKTGTDQHAVPWPIFHSRCLGANRSTLFLYALIPFQALGGLNVWTTRLPAALSGILCVALIYWVAARLFGRTTGLCAAALLAVNPWHLHLSRWGHEASLAPLLGLAPLALMLWAGLLPAQNNRCTSRIARAILAGLLTGLCCYGYPALRLFVPAFVLLIFLATWTDGWRPRTKTRRGAAALIGFVVALAVTFGPLAFKHLTDPHGIGHRGSATLFWNERQPFETVLANVTARYRDHFGPDFLFLRGDHYAVHSCPDMGQFHWYMLPLLLAGLAALIARFRRSPAARVLFVGILAYPVGDILSAHPGGGLHALRSAPGLCSLILLAAWGATQATSRLANRGRRLKWGVAGVFLALAITLNARYLHRYFGTYADQPGIYDAFQADLFTAFRWLHPRLDEVDAVYCTARGANLPYAVSLVVLRYDPQTWFSQPREFVTQGQWDVYHRYGKMHFLYDSHLADLPNTLRERHPGQRVILILRPAEALRLHAAVPPAHTIGGPGEQLRLLVYDLMP